MGFIVTEEEARAMIKRDQRNREVLFPYLNGEDLNSDPEQKPSRWVINFWDWPEEKAKTYREPYEIVKAKVKPERERLRTRGNHIGDNWWHFAEKRPGPLSRDWQRDVAFDSHPANWGRTQATLTDA